MTLSPCPTCGQPWTGPEQQEPASASESPFAALLTADERSRGVCRLHELSPNRQAEVRTALKAARP